MCASLPFPHSMTNSVTARLTDLLSMGSTGVNIPCEEWHSAFGQRSDLKRRYRGRLSEWSQAWKPATTIEDSGSLTCCPSNKGGRISTWSRPSKLSESSTTLTPPPGSSWLATTQRASPGQLATQ